MQNVKKNQLDRTDDHEQTSNCVYDALFKVQYLIRAGLSQTGNRSLGWLLSSTATEKVDTVKTKERTAWI